MKARYSRTLWVEYRDGERQRFAYKSGETDAIYGNVLDHVSPAVEDNEHLIPLRWPMVVEETSSREVRRVRFGRGQWFNVLWRSRPTLKEQAHRVEILALLELAESRRGGSFASAKEDRRDSPQAGSR